MSFIKKMWCFLTFLENTNDDEKKVETGFLVFFTFWVQRILSIAETETIFLIYFFYKPTNCVCSRGRYAEAENTMCLLRGQRREDIRTELEALDKTLGEVKQLMNWFRV